jgi:GDP-4-dehydro-6-deoxy-D-mannose reductase
MRVLVTGASGFVGRWMVDELRSAGHEVIATPPHDRLDINDLPALAALIRSARPDGVIHLAGMAFGPDASLDPEGAERVNVRGTSTLLEAVRSISPRPAVLVAGSAEVYGAPNPGALPIDESAATSPRNAYGRSKLAQEEAALAAARAGHLAIAVTRSFNHTGPGQRPVFVAPALARRLLAAQKSGQGEIAVGNIDVRRDIGDVRDTVRAYRLILEGLARDEIAPGTVLNVATGRSVLIRDILDILAELIGVAVQPRIDASLVRAADPPDIVGDASRLRALTGWEPRIPLRQTLSDLVDSLRSAPA